MLNNLISLIGKTREWGTNLFQVPSERSAYTKLEVYRIASDERILVGRLTSEAGVYIFRYDENYNGSPVPAFPDRGREYRSELLWPFFAIRIPPLEREDVRQEMERKKLDEEDVFGILGTLGRISISNPYELRLVSSA